MRRIAAQLIYDGNDVVSDGVLNYDTDKISGISSEAKSDLDFRCSVITPAFIDPHAHIGMIRAGEPAGEAEANDQMESIIAHADALDSIQMDDASFRDSIEAGVLYSCVVPGSGNIVGGRSAVIRNYGNNTTSALIGRAGIKAALGYNPMSTRSWKGTRPFTRMGALALLRDRLHETREKVKKKKEEDEPIAADEEIFRALLKGREVLRVHVHKIDDIAALLRLVDEFRLKVTVDHSCDVHAGEIYNELAKRRISVVYGPMDTFPYKVELKHENWRNIQGLIDSGVQYGLMTDHPVLLQKMLLLQLRWFLRAGLSRQQAIEIITRQNARIAGLTDHLGELSSGKWASFLCWNGDPFDLASYPIAVVAEGKIISGSFEDSVAR